jgi:hypothetical protein
MLIVFCILLSPLLQGCASSVRTYKNYRLDPAYEYAWLLNLRGGQHVLFYDFGRIEITTDSVEIGCSHRRMIALSDVVSIEKLDTKNSHGTTVGLAMVGALAGGYTLGKLAANAVTEDRSDDKKFLRALNAAITKAIVGGFGMVVGIIVGAAAGRRLAQKIESATSREIIDLSGLPVEVKASRIDALKRQYPSRTSAAGHPRFVRIEQRDGSTVEGELVLSMEKELVVVRTADGEITIPWADIKSQRRIVKPTLMKEEQP